MDRFLDSGSDDWGQLVMIGVFDCETTGLIKNTIRPLSKQPKITEIAFIRLDDDLKEIDRFESFFNVGEKLDEKITKITSITDEMLADAPQFGAKALFLQEFVEECDTIVAHNLAFDYQMLKFDFMRCDIVLAWPDLRCTLEATEHWHGYRLSQAALYEELFDKTFEGAHRAINDVEALVEIYVELKRRGEI